MECAGVCRAVPRTTPGTVCLSVPTGVPPPLGGTVTLSTVRSGAENVERAG
jgi:hypothetical protein